MSFLQSFPRAEPGGLGGLGAAQGSALGRLQGGQDGALVQHQGIISNDPRMFSMPTPTRDFPFSIPKEKTLREELQSEVEEDQEDDATDANAETMDDMEGGEGEGGMDDMEGDVLGGL